MYTLIPAMIFLFAFSLFGCLTLDTYMKLMGKPLIRKNFVRFTTIHCGSYIENQITLNGNSVSIPDTTNRGAISVTVFVLEVLNLIYVMATIAIVIIALTTANNVITIVSFVLCVIYLILVLILFFRSTVLLNKEQAKRCESKFNELKEASVKNTLLLDDALQHLNQGKRVSFELYGLSFSLEAYKKDKCQLLDLTHGRILMVNKELMEIVKNVSINSKTLRKLWPYLEIKVLE